MYNLAWTEQNLWMWGSTALNTGIKTYMLCLWLSIQHPGYGSHILVIDPAVCLVIDPTSWIWILHPSYIDPTLWLWILYLSYRLRILVIHPTS